MVHYALIKFQPGTYTDELRKFTLDTFAALAKEVPTILSAQVFDNGYKRDSNADIMVRVEVTSAETLPLYLNHPLHVKFGQTIAPYRSQPIVSFDRAE